MDIAKITNNFIEEILYIENFKHSNDSEEPVTKWVKQIDPRTNYPFYWNKDTKESLWDIPIEYKTYFKEMKTYLDNLKSNFDMAFSESKKNNVKQVKTLIGYSDSEDEEDEESSMKASEADNVQIPEPVENDNKEEEAEEEWFIDQTKEAVEYLNKLIDDKSNELKIKVEFLSQFKLCQKYIENSVIENQTRLSDWKDGFLVRKRVVEKLSEHLSNLSYLEDSLETDQWRIIWDDDIKIYKCQNKHSGDYTDDFTVLIHNTEEGEIIEDPEEKNADDLLIDLEEYVCKELHSLDNGTGKLVNSYTEGVVIDVEDYVCKDSQSPLDN